MVCTEERQPPKARMRHQHVPRNLSRAHERRFRLRDQTRLYSRFQPGRRQACDRRAEAVLPASFFPAHPSEPKVNIQGIEELVADKGYHSGEALEQVKEEKVRTYIPEKKQPRKRHWKGKQGLGHFTFQHSDAMCRVRYR